MSEHKRPTQCQRVVKYMRDFGSITSHEADRELGVKRLPSRIHELKKMGYAIVGEFVPVRNRYGETCHIKRYRMMEE